MVFKLSSKPLLKALQLASKAQASKSVISDLDNFLFSVGKTQVYIMASDNDNTLIVQLDLIVADSEGSFSIDAKKLLDLLKRLPDTPLEFRVNDAYKVEIRYGNGSYKFQGDSGDSFPRPLQNMENATELHLPAPHIFEGLGNTLFAVYAKDNNHPQMMGVRFDIAPDKATLVASDSSKLVMHTENGIQTGKEIAFTVPTKAATLLKDMLDKNEGMVNVTTDGKRAQFATDKATLYCRLVEGRFPNYRAVIPTSCNHTLLIDRKALLAAIKRVSVFAGVSGLLKLEFKPERVLVSTEDVDYSTSAIERVECDYPEDAEPLAIGFNNEHLVSVLEHITTENVVAQLTDPSRAGIFLPSETREGCDVMFLQMPMMLVQ